MSENYHVVLALIFRNGFVREVFPNGLSYWIWNIGWFFSLQNSTSGIQTGAKETQAHGYTKPAQNKEVSAATGVPQGARTAAGQVSCALPRVTGSQQSILFGETESQGLKWEGATLPLAWAVMQWKLVQVPKQQLCCLWHKSPHSPMEILWQQEIPVSNNVSEMDLVEAN